MEDMKPSDVTGPVREFALRYHDGTTRRVLAGDVEVPFPPGELIVSQTDLEGRITMCNEGFVRMSGYPRHELLGQPHHILRHPDMPAAAFRDLWETISQGRRWNGYVKNLRKDGAFYWVYATVIPKSRQGAIVGYTSVRREPSRARVAEAEKLYASMRDSAAHSGSAV
ncbi:MAG: PAS domain-containing protein [Thermoanaerobaculia bacterium]